MVDERPVIEFEEISDASTGDGPSRRKVKRLEKREAKQAAKRPLLRRLFGIGLWGGLKLAALCILVGIFVMAANFNPADPNVNVSAAISSVAQQAWAATGWMVRNFWQPALAGATIVMPLWVIWRLLSLPFRK